MATLASFVDGYTSEANCQSNTSPTIATVKVGPVTTSWAIYGTGANTNVGSFGASATWARVHFFVSCTSSCSNSITNIDGVRLTENPQSNGNGGLDYAENYPADPNHIPQPGDVVALESSGSAATVQPAHIPMDQSVIGVVSSNPGEVLDDGSVPDPKVPVALAGRILTNVSTKNGAIHTGDYLTSSDIPGVAVKATTAGPVIGVAMQDFTCGLNGDCQGKILMFVKNTFTTGSQANVFDDTLSQDDLAFLGSLIQSSATTSAVILPSDLSKNHVVGGLEVLTKRVEQLEGRVASLSASVSTGSATSCAGGECSASVSGSGKDETIDGLTLEKDATVSGDLRVKGSGLFEGVLSVIDTLKANNFIATSIAEFFDQVIFHSDVSFEGRPTFSSDTGGFAIIKKGFAAVHITFDKEYAQTPVVVATITLDALSPTPQISTIPAVLSDNVSFVITDRSTKGFTIQLNKTATTDISFSWTALAINNAKTFTGNTQTTTKNVQPTPTSLPSVSSTPVPTLSVTPVISLSPSPAGSSDAVVQKGGE